jgi:hypothetical protein
MNPFFNWLKDSGTQAMLVLGGTVAAFVAAIGTIYFGRKTLTKEDLTPLEEHMATTSSHLEKVHTSLKRMDDRQKKQDDNESLASRAQRISLSVSGEACADAGQSMVLRISTYSTDVMFRRLDLLNENENNFGSVGCVHAGPEYQATINPITFKRWMQNGNPGDQLIATVKMRVWLIFTFESGAPPSNEACRDLAVTIRKDSRGSYPNSADAINVYTIEGRV